MLTEERREYERSYYADSPARQIAVRSRNRVLRQELQAFVDWLKSVPCMDCHKTYSPVCMDFDHVRGEKVAGIAILVRNKVGIQAILEEAQKCEVVCANCHRMRTQRRKN